jgi:hypothetical protein
MGIGSVACVAIKEGRNAAGFELKESYHTQAIRNCERHVREWKDRQRPTGNLFSRVEAAV